MHCYYWDFAIWPFTSLIMISYWDLYHSRRNSVIDTLPSIAVIILRLFDAALPESPAESGCRDTHLSHESCGWGPCRSVSQDFYWQSRPHPRKVTPGPVPAPLPERLQQWLGASPGRGGARRGGGEWGGRRRGTRRAAAAAVPWAE